MMIMIDYDFLITIIKISIDPNHHNLSVYHLEQFFIPALLLNDLPGDHLAIGFHPE